MLQYILIWLENSGHDKISCCSFLKYFLIYRDKCQFWTEHHREIFTNVNDFRGRSFGLHKTNWGDDSWKMSPRLGRTSRNGSDSTVTFTSPLGISIYNLFDNFYFKISVKSHQESLSINSLWFYLAFLKPLVEYCFFK